MNYGSNIVVSLSNSKLFGVKAKTRNHTTKNKKTKQLNLSNMIIRVSSVIEFTYLKEINNRKLNFKTILLRLANNFKFKTSKI
jgi:hypothetical protein